MLDSHEISQLDSSIKVIYRSVENIYQKQQQYHQNLQHAQQVQKQKQKQKQISDDEELFEKEIHTNIDWPELLVGRIKLQ